MIFRQYLFFNCVGNTYFLTIAPTCPVVVGNFKKTFLFLPRLQAIQIYELETILKAESLFVLCSVRSGSQKLNFMIEVCSSPLSLWFKMDEGSQLHSWRFIFLEKSHQNFFSKETLNTFQTLDRLLSLNKIKNHLIFNSLCSLPPLRKL